MVALGWARALRVHQPAENPLSRIGCGVETQQATVLITGMEFPAAEILRLLCCAGAMNALREHIDAGHAGADPGADTGADVDAGAGAGVFVERRHFERALAQLQETTVSPGALQ